MPRPTVRVEFTRKHDTFLVKYLATYYPSKAGRCGNLPFERLVDNADGHWPWAVHHTWQSWRARYVKNANHFDAHIVNYQRKHNIDIKSVDKRKRDADPMPIEALRPSAKRVRREEEEEEEEEESPSSETRANIDIKSMDKRKRDVEPMPIEALRPSAKRVRREEEGEEEEEEEEGSPSSETRATTPHENVGSSRPKPTSKSIPKQPPETPSQAPNPTREPEPSSSRSNANANASASAAEKPTPDLTALQTRHDTLEILSSSPHRQAPPPTDGNPEPRTPPRHVKRVKVRLRTPSDMFASEPPSPRRDAAPVVSVGGPSSQTRPAPSAPSTSADGSPVATSVYPRAPPRIVDSLHGQVLVDREGHVPRALLHGDEPGAEQEEQEEQEEDKAPWPPARGRTAKQRRASGPDFEVDAHHAFSQSQPQPRPETPRESVAMGEREREKPNRLLGPVSRALLDRRTVAARFSGQVSHGVAPQVESERPEDMMRDGASPVKRVVATAPPSDPFSGFIPKPLSKVLKFPVPRASTRSPFRPEPPAKETRPPQPQRRPQSRTRAARHPTRIRRQTISHGRGNGHGNGNGNEHDYRREHGQVPSVDLVALSHSSMSARSHSRSSGSASVPQRPPRWSLPAFAHATPWVFDGPDGAPLAPRLALASGSGSSFMWAAPSAVHGDVWGHGRTRTSTPRFMWTPSPARSVAGGTNANGSGPRANGTPASPSLTPHPPDLHLTATQGLASILAHMSANHGLASGVVEAVYARVGSLREADEVLRGMREAAEGFGEREIERRLRGRRGSGVGREERAEEEQGGGDGDARRQLRYVVASEDGEGSEYSPPETSRAAMWKRQSESVSHVEEEEEDEEEGRAVEEELRDYDEHEDDGENGPHHDFSPHVPLAEGNDEDKDDGDAWEEQSVTETLLDMRLAQELERKVGKARYRRDIARLFV